MSIATRYEHVRSQLADAARACGRDPESVRLIAVSKTVGVEGVDAALRAGARDFGENRPDGLATKASAHPDAVWHFIGNVQSRRIPDIVASSDMVHSLYQAHHVPAFEKAAAAQGKLLDLLIEVNVSGEQSKSGCAPSRALELVQTVNEAEHLRARGLMTMAPRGARSLARSCFDALAELSRAIRASLSDAERDLFNELSMGMSEDWREAVPAGATMVRIGRAIFDDAFEPPAPETASDKA